MNSSEESARDRGAWLKRLQDPDPLERGRAVDALAEFGDPALAGVLRPVLLDPDQILAFKAALGLAWLGDDGGLELLLHALGNADLCALALEALGRLGSPRALDDLRRFFKRRRLHPLERLLAAAALLRCGEPEGEQFLRASLESERPEVRGFALELLGRLRLPDALERLNQVLADPENPHRLDAVRGLAALGDRRALPLLDRVVQEGRDPELAEEAAAAAAWLRENES